MQTHEVVENDDKTKTETSLCIFFSRTQTATMHSSRPSAWNHTLRLHRILVLHVGVLCQRDLAHAPLCSQPAGFRVTLQPACDHPHKYKTPRLLFLLHCGSSASSPPHSFRFSGSSTAEQSAVQQHPPVRPLSWYPSVTTASG